MATLKELLEELQESKHKLAIWEEIKEFIAHRSEAEGFWLDQSNKVLKSYVDEVLEEIDSEMVSKLHSQIKKIENTEIGNGVGARKKGRSTRKSSS